MTSFPSLSVDGSKAGVSPSLVPPPRFRPPGIIAQTVLRHSPYTRAFGLTGAQKNGLRYESYVQRAMLTKFENYNAGSYIHFLDSGAARTAQPDGLLETPESVFIFEIKFQHCPDSWWQLEKLYRPLLERLRPSKTISVVEICRSFDPAVAFPSAFERVKDLESWVREPRKSFGVYEWRRPPRPRFEER